MAVTTTKTNKPINPRGNDQSPKGYNRAALYSGKALDFDGVNDVIEFDGYTTFTGDFSFSMYIKTSLIAQRGLLCDSANNDGILLYTNDQEIRIRIDGSNYIWDTGLPIYNNKMNQLVFVRNGVTITPYLNGVAGNSVTATSGTFAFNQFGRQTTTANYFDGQAANIKAFNTAITAAQVSDLYNNPEKIVPTGVSNDALKLWLPMMEGAGTTAYDGSGNGNHGTISGATWTHGIGSPVAQTAVIDWNKTSNLVTYSEDFTQWGTNDSPTITASSTIAPDGSTNAYEITDNTSSGYARIRSNTVTMSGDYIGSVYIKKTTGSLTNYPGFDIGGPGHYVIVDTTNGTAVDTGSHYSDITVTSYNDDWWRVSAKSNVTTTTNAIRFWPALSDNGTSVSASATGSATFWGAQLEQASSVGPYIRTGATAQTSDVLLPQGLTSGRDITGVNLFENVRKQGALNLDGNSWAEVHDNASLDFGTGSFTLEAWARVKFVDQGTPLNVIISLGGSAASEEALYIYDTITARFEYNGFPSVTGTLTQGNWVHLVGTYDGTNATIYLNGSQADQDARTAADITNDLVKYIGRDNQSTRFYNDQIAQPRIYNRALTAEEVERNYNAGKNIYK